MKKLLLTFSIIILFSNESSAACGNYTEVYYKVNNKKVTKEKAKVTECGNMLGSFKELKFKNGVKFSSGIDLNDNAEIIKEWNLINGKNAKRIKTPQGVPGSYICYSTSQQNTAYCINNN